MVSSYRRRAGACRCPADERRLPCRRSRTRSARVLTGTSWRSGGRHGTSERWYKQKRYCQKKLCFVATDQALLADVLRQLAERPDCYYVKYSIHQRDGMYLGRCFLMDEHEVGMLWAKYKEHPRLFCSVQDDDFTAPFRPS